ncbi:MAG: DAK2 domain-containing protein, partial [Lachnospiraceae bacterium]|nr:DAK2 domain-containing protein [Lachnospiraceae bacterium]
TYAVRDTMIDDKEIHQGDYMGIGDKTILSVGKDMEMVTREMVSEMIDEESAIVCIYYGEEASEEDANKLAEDIEADYPDVEVEVHFGGQPIYYYVISVE